MARPSQVYTCEPGQTLDITTRVCRGTSVRDGEVVVHRPEPVVVESSPLVVGLTRPAQEFREEDVIAHVCTVIIRGSKTFFQGGTTCRGCTVVSPS